MRLYEAMARKEGAMWVVDVPGVGVTQAEFADECLRMAADLVESVHPGQVFNLVVKYDNQ